jgi:UDPglucose 6-dehydrogenase
VNQRQRERMVDKIVGLLDGDPRGKTVAALGLSFKPETDDVRDAPSIEILRGLLQRGVSVRAYDPEAMQAGASLLPEVTMCEDAYAACRDADALVILTEWNQFRMLDLNRVKELLRRPALADLRNVYDPGPMRAAGFIYAGVGR